MNILGLAETHLSLKYGTERAVKSKVNLKFLKDYSRKPKSMLLKCFVEDTFQRSTILVDQLVRYTIIQYG